MRYLLIVDAKSEAKQTELAKKLEGDGFGVTKRTGVKRDRVAKKAKPKSGAKKPAAAKKAGAPKPYARKRAKPAK